MKFDEINCKRKFSIKKSKENIDIKIIICNDSKTVNSEKKFRMEDTYTLTIDYYADNNQRKTVCFHNDELVSGSIDDKVYQVLIRELKLHESLIGTYDTYRILSCLDLSVD